MYIHDVKPTALAIHDGNQWRPLGDPETFSRAVDQLSALVVAGLGETPAALSGIVWKDDRRLKPENRKRLFRMEKTVSEILEQVTAGQALENQRAAMSPARRIAA